MENLFIQFCQTTVKQTNTVGGSFLKRGDHFQILTNGFSYVWDYANPIWVDLDSDFNVTKLPVELSNYQKVYVSVSFFDHAFIVFDWAKKYPQVNFIMGGPAVNFVDMVSDFTKKQFMIKLPSNVSITNESAESIFGLPFDINRFKIDLPDFNTPRLYHFRIGSGCYWSRCNFCIYRHENYTNFEIDPETIQNIPPGGVWLGTESLSPKSCELLTQLNYDDRRYHCFLRGDTSAYKSLQKILPMIKESSHLRFFMGIEFPSNRMLQMMGKGTDIETLIKVIHLLTDAGCKVSLSFITEWECIEKNDVEEAKNFFKMLPDESTYDSYYNPLVNWFGDVKKENFIGKLTGEQKRLNSQWQSILHKYGCLKYGISSERIKQRMLKFRELMP